MITVTGSFSVDFELKLVEEEEGDDELEEGGDEDDNEDDDDEVDEGDFGSFEVLGPFPLSELGLDPLSEP